MTRSTLAEMLGAGNAPSQAGMQTGLRVDGLKVPIPIFWVGMVERGNPMLF